MILEVKEFCDLIGRKPRASGDDPFALKNAVNKHE